MTAMATPGTGSVSRRRRCARSRPSVADASVWSMDAAETAKTLVELTRLRAQVAELEARVAAHADDQNVGATTGATSAANWLAHATRQTRPEAHRTVRLGHWL